MGQVFRPVAATFFLILTAAAADLRTELLNAARKGDDTRVTALLAKGAPPDARDKNGRTPMMLAAQRGHAPTARLLLSKGASADARDRQGWTAFALALLSPDDREAVLRALPAPPKLRLVMDVKWAAGNLYSSCLMSLPQLAQHVAAIQPDAQTANAFRDIASVSAKAMVEVSPDESGDAVLHLKVRPSVSCVAQQSADNLSLAIDARFERSNDRKLLLEKTYGGGLKGLHARSATSPAQYGELFAEWAKNHATSIYWAMLEAWLRAAP